jgi:hypothetical protein
MQFTPQQLAGAGRYSQKTKIGNWCEDQSLTNAKLQDYLQRKAAGNLLTMESKIRRNSLEMLVPLTHTKDGCIHFGDAIQLRSQRIGTNSALCSNIYDPVVLDGEVFGTSVAPPGSMVGSNPTARSTHIIEKWDGYDKYSDDGILRYGDPFLIACHPSLRVDNKTGLLKPLLHLRSSRVSNVDYAKMSNHQLVAMVGSSKIDYNMVWEASRVANRKYQPKGSPILANDPIVLLHRATGSPLACNPSYSLQSEFGEEYEVSCHKYSTFGKTLNLVLEQEGQCTGDVGQRSEQTANVWYIDTATEPNNANDTSWGIPMSPAILINAIREILNKNNNVETLIGSFNVIDKRGNGVIDRQEFIWVLRDFGITLNEIESNIILNYFDINNDGAIPINEFAKAIQSNGNGGVSKDDKK